MHQDTKQAGVDVLVVDDDPTILNLVTEFLEDEGYNVRRAGDGWEAWQAIQAAPPMLLVTDIRMPRMTGSELVLRLRAHGSAIPILLMAATPALAEPLMQFDCIEFIAKPFKLELLLDGVQRYLAPANSPASVAGVNSFTF
jgi:two-component system, chemotaxis family, chemotaxis protein CheY